MSADLAGLDRIAPLLREVCDLKRVRAAHVHGSIAETAFTRAWSAVVSGGDSNDIALCEAAKAVVATRLAACDPERLSDAGLAADEIRTLERTALAQHAEHVPRSLMRSLAAALDASTSHLDKAVDLPPFVGLLNAQPRAGATRPGHARLVLEPAESHAEHCWSVGVMAVLVSPLAGADPGPPFVAALAHHLHNAWLPDAGFSGEELLGYRLAAVVARFTERALEQLPARAEASIREARRLLEDDSSPEARAFQAADVLDRVLQIDHYARSARFELREALEHLELVHPGPLQRFQLDVLKHAGLWRC